MSVYRTIGPLVLVLLHAEKAANTNSSDDTLVIECDLRCHLAK